VLRRASHPNCVVFFGTFGDPRYGAHGLVMEYLRDGSLQQRLESPSLSATVDVAALKIADGIAAGLAHLHGIAILHRDLKPANVLLNGDIPKLADFGLANLVGGDAGDKDQTVCGTPRWMAPEVLAGRDYGFPADIYAYALVLWQVLAWCAKPYPDQGHRGLGNFLRHLEAGNRPSLDACRARSAPQVLCELVAACWAPDPSARPEVDGLAGEVERGRAELERMRSELAAEELAQDLARARVAD